MVPRESRWKDHHRFFVPNTEAEWMARGPMHARALPQPRARPAPGLGDELDARGFEGGAQIDFVAGEKVRRRLAILEGRNKPKRNVRRRRELEAGPTHALASLAALLPGHFAPSAASRRVRLGSRR